MEIVYHTTGTHRGAVSVLNTIATMEVGETWQTNSSEVQLAYVQVCCSRYGWNTGKRFTVNAARRLNGQIIITRIA